MTVYQITEGFQCVNTWAVTHCRPYISWHLHLQVGSDCWRLKFHAKHLHIVSSSSFLALLLKHYKNDSVSNFKHRVVFITFYIHITRKYLVLPRDSTGVGWPRGWIFKITEPCMKAFSNNIFWFSEISFVIHRRTDGQTDRLLVEIVIDYFFSCKHLVKVKSREWKQKWYYTVKNYKVGWLQNK